MRINQGGHKNWEQQNGRNMYVRAEVEPCAANRPGMYSAAQGLMWGRGYVGSSTSLKRKPDMLKSVCALDQGLSSTLVHFLSSTQAVVYP